MFKILYSLLIIISGSLCLSAEPIKIAILDFTKTGISAAENTEISGYLRKELTSKENTGVISRDDMNKSFTEAKFNASGCADNDCANEAAGILKSDFVFFGIIIKTEKKYSITVGSYNVKSRDKSFIERFESDSLQDIKKKMILFTDKVASGFPKQEILTEAEIQERKNQRPYAMKYLIALNTGYLMTNAKMNYNMIDYKAGDANFLISGIKFQIEILNSWKFGVIGEFAYPLTPATGTNPYWGSGGIIISFSEEIYGKFFLVCVDAALLGGSYSRTNSDLPFATFSPRISFQLFPVSIFGIELSYCYNYNFAILPDNQTLGLNFIFKF